MGFSRRNKQYLVWNVVTKRLEEARDIHLDKKGLVSSNVDRFANGFETDMVPKYLNIEKNLEEKNQSTKPSKPIVVEDEGVELDNFPIIQDSSLKETGIISSVPRIQSPT